MKQLWKYFFILWLLSFCTCNQRQTKSAEEYSNESLVLTPGKLYERVKCKSDSSYSYALFLPKSYRNAKENPVLFFFDAHKRGKTPVWKYHELADAYGFILAGSNNSANGQSVKEMDKAISMMMIDAGIRLKPDSFRIYTGGFSGGARVASYTALFKGKITGVAGCAAGFPQINKKPNRQFIYIGLVGDEDFNYLEMKNLDRSLERAGLTHLLVVYKGAHDWPPSNVMENAFMFFQFDAMHKQLLPVDSSEIKHFIRLNEKYISHAVKRKDWIEQAFGLKRAIIFLAGIYDVSTYKEKLVHLGNSAHYKRQCGEEARLEEVEQKLQQSFGDAMADPGCYNWLMEEMDTIYDTVSSSDNHYVIKMNKRILNFLSLLSFMYSSNALKSSDMKLAKIYLNIYEKADPDNPEVYYLKAVRLARLHKNRKAVDELKKALQYGFGDAARMENDKSFLSLHKESDFQIILEQISQNSL